MKLNHALFSIGVVIVMIATILAFAMPASAKDKSCGNDVNCLIAERVPDALATLKAQALAEATETVLPTETEPPLPTETPVVTETPSPIVTEPPTVTETPIYTLTKVPPTDLTRIPKEEKKNMSCERAWIKITETVYERETGFRYFENPNHRYCQTWLYKKHGIVWADYKVMYPLK